MSDQEKSESEALFNLTEIGSEIAGGLAPIAVGAILAGPMGAVAGAIVAPFAGRTFGKLAKEFNERVLGRREKMRVGAVILLARAKIQEKLDAGQQPRQDGFFEASPDDRAAADEIAEGVVLAAQREYQERKIKYYANLLSNLAFRSDIDRGMANALLQQVERMSYRQLCLLSLLTQRDIFPDLPHTLQYSLVSAERRTAEEQSLSTDLYGLSQQGILDFIPIMDETHIQLSYVLGLGTLLFELLELGDIDAKELAQLAEPLRKQGYYQQQQPPDPTLT